MKGRGILALIGCLCSTAAFASEYYFDTPHELTLLGVGLSMGVAGVYLDRTRDTPTPADLATLDKQDIPAFDRWAAGRWNPDAATRGDYLAAASMLLPLSLAGSDRLTWTEFAVLYAETHVIVNGGVSLAKGAAQRHRPYAYNQSLSTEQRSGDDIDRSFFSGHTARTAASLTFMAKVFDDTHPNSVYTPYLWTGAALGSLWEAWLRVDSGHHFPSDVLVGLAWGASMGYYIPESHRKRKPNSWQLSSYTNSSSTGIVLTHAF